MRQHEDSNSDEVLQVLENKRNRRINERKKHPPEWQQHFPRTSPPSWQQFLDKLGAGFTGGERRYLGPSLQSFTLCQ